MFNYWIFALLSISFLFEFTLTKAQNRENDKIELFVEIDKDFCHKVIGKNLAYYQDFSNNLKIQQLTSPIILEQFIQFKDHSVNSGFNQPVHWFQFTLENTDTLAKELVLEVQWAFLDSIILFSKDNSEQWVSQLQGDKINRNKPEKLFGCTNFPAFFINLDANTTDTYYIKVFTSGIFKFPPKLYVKDKYFDQLIIRNLSYGVLYGMLIVFIFAGIVMLLLTKRSFLVYFSLYVLFFGLFQLSWDGIGNELIWTQNHWLHKRSVIIFISLWMLFNLAFTGSFLETKRYFPNLSKLILYSVFFIPFLTLIGLYDYNLGYFLGTLSAIIAALVMMVIGVKAALNNIIGAKFFAISRILFFSFGLITGLSVLGLVKSSPFTESALLYAFIVDTVFMFFAIARKSKLMNLEELYLKSELVDKVDNGVLILDHFGYIKWANKGFSKISGYSHDELLNQIPRYLMLSPNSSQEAINKIDLMHYQNNPYNVEILVQPKEGKEKWLQIRTTPIFNRVGKLEKTIEVYTDITDTKESEIKIKRYLNNLELLKVILHELHNSDNFFNSLENLLKVIILSNENILLVGFETINSETGKFNATNMDRSFSISYNNDFYQKEDVKYKTLLKGKNYLENNLETKENQNKTDVLLIGFKVYSFVLIPIFVENKLYASLGIGVGSPQSYDAELDNLYAEIGFIFSKSILASIQKEKLAESEYNFKLLTENIDQVFWLSDPIKNELLIVSKAYEKIFDKPAKSLIENPASWTDMIHPEDRERVRESYKLNSKKGDFYEKYRILDKNNGYKWLSSKTFPIKDENGEIYRLAGITEDITDEKTAQDILDSLNKKFTDSIKYSSRIQNTILPTEEIFNQFFEDFFLIYRPLDIVSGDFYWMEQSPKNPDVLIFGVIDCTGHGVPGALLSIIGNHFLTQAVKFLGLTNPVKIIHYLNKGIIETIHRKMEFPMDGMDLSLCSFNKRTKELSFAGANGRIIIINDKGMEIVKDRRIAIGHIKDKVNSSPVKRIINKGDQIYFSSDGYYDQFGGETGKKMMFKRYAENILNSSHLEMKNQKKSVTNYLDNWMKGKYQIDDICVMGLKF